jgi:DNA-binding LytR/AlgR family response regulator
MMNCIAIDDEPLALQVIKEFCDKIPFINLQQCFTSPEEARAFLKTTSADLIFLDIQMPDCNGVELYKSLPEKIPVIFTTAYKDFALEGFNVDAVDYLLKPFDYARFLKSVYKAKEYIEFISSKDMELSSIFVKVNYELMRIHLKDIDLVEALDDYIRIHIKPHPVLTLMTLKGIQEKLPAKEFIRVHRSYIVPVNKIEKFNRQKVTVAGKEIPVGSSYGTVIDDLQKLKQA